MIESGRHLADAGAPISESASVRSSAFSPPYDPAVVEGDSGPCVPVEDPGVERLRLLVSTVEAQIIPRLVIAHRSGTGPGDALAKSGSARPRTEELETCVRLLLDPGVSPLQEFAEDLLARGVTLDCLYLEIFAPAARRLGDMWDRDECSFTDVTIALGRLQQSLRRFAAHFRPESLDGSPWRRALFCAAPGEQHTFGLSMIVQYFLRAGWDASMLPSPAAEDMARLVQQEPIALVGLSMSKLGHAPALKLLIARVRAASCNVALRVIVGGVAFVNQPALAAEMGADGTATDAEHAVNLAQQLVL